MYISYAKTVEDFRKEVVTVLRIEAERRASEQTYARTKAMREAARVRENELRQQATFFERITFVQREDDRGV